MEKKDFKDRKFKFWFYQVSHSEAIIRSPKTEKYNINIDIYLSMDISVNNVVILISEGKRYYVVASIIKVMENDLDYGLLPIYDFLTKKDNLRW